MTRKDYELIAGTLKTSRGNWIGLVAQIQAIECVAHDMARALKRDNPRFDVNRFLVACGIPESEINQ